MADSVDDNLSGTEQFNGRCFVDIHNHCLPGVDDGPETLSQSLALCRQLVDDGVTTVIATPHQLGRYSECNDAEQIRGAVAEFNEKLKDNGIVLTVVPGADVRIDERICELLEADKILTLADGHRYLLLELPHEIFIDIEPLLVELSSSGVQVVVSHPERHHILAQRPELLQRWSGRSACFQVTAGSLLGDFGRMAQKAAWYFLRTGLSLLVATDSHNLENRRPCLRDAFERISVKLGARVARLVCIENPLRVLKGQDITTEPYLVDSQGSHIGFESPEVNGEMSTPTVGSVNTRGRSGSGKK